MDSYNFLGLYFRFFVLVLIYIVGGILFLHFARGANGKEMIPNFEFWKDFPFLVKVSFIVNHLWRFCYNVCLYLSLLLGMFWDEHLS